jgi:hypothetical protein
MSNFRFSLDACGFYDDFKYHPKTISLFKVISLKNINSLVCVVQRGPTIHDEESAIEINLDLLSNVNTESISQKLHHTRKDPLKEGEIRFLVYNSKAKDYFMLKLYPHGYFEIKEIFQTIEIFREVVDEVCKLISIALKKPITLFKYNFNKVVRLEYEQKNIKRIKNYLFGEA